MCLTRVAQPGSVCPALTLLTPSHVELCNIAETLFHTNICKTPAQGSKATERTMAELKEFAGELKALPNISRHISLAEELSRRIARPGFRDRVTVEQALLDGHSLDSTAETLEVWR